ncbi:MAG: CBS domain-containing protein [Actinomycetota bacterium]
MEEGIRKMHDAQVRHLLVTGQDDFVGVISTRDLLRVLAPDVLRVRQEA